MKVTALTAQQRNPQRVNVMVDGSFRFSLDMSQILLLGIKSGNEYSEDELRDIEQESVFGKLYERALEYSFVRPRSAKEMKDYLYRKTRPTRQKNGSLKPGVSSVITERVYSQLLNKGRIDDERFAIYWVENRFVRKGVSKKRLLQELMQKGVERSLIDRILLASERDEREDLKKVIAKKHSRYDDEKLIQYLLRQGFRYDDIIDCLAGSKD